MYDILQAPQVNLQQGQLFLLNFRLLAISRQDHKILMEPLKYLGDKINYVVELCFDLFVDGHDLSGVPDPKTQLVHAVDQQVEFEVQGCFGLEDGPGGVGHRNQQGLLF